MREHTGTPSVRDDRFAGPPQPASRGRRTDRLRGQVQNLSRRKAVWVALVLVPTVVVGLALARASGPGESVLAAARGLQPGDVISDRDLKDVFVKATGVALIPASERGSLVGKQVVGSLSAGALLSPASVSSGPGLVPGEVGMALALDPDQAATGILAVGQSVLIVGQASGGGGQAPTRLAAPARILGILPSSSLSGKVVVDLALASPADAGPVAAAVASASGVRLVVLPGAGRGS